jgi:hypothetical protein
MRLISWDFILGEKLPSHSTLRYFTNDAFLTELVIQRRMGVCLGMMNWDGYGRGDPGMFKVLSQHLSTSVGITGIWAKNQTRNLKNNKKITANHSTATLSNLLVEMSVLKNTRTVGIHEATRVACLVSTLYLWPRVCKTLRLPGST